MVREQLEAEIVRSAGSGVDLDAACWNFLGTNSKACLVVLALADAELDDEIERRMEDGEGLGHVARFDI